ncbi:MAG: hypothetical protein OHK0029_30530 [Armatimonadaceae bacterium]
MQPLQIREKALARSRIQKRSSDAREMNGWSKERGKIQEILSNKIIPQMPSD